VIQDRLGTNRFTGARYRPYGDEITSTPNDFTKFATYFRDGFTGVDYADQRYYASTNGRFATADPAGTDAVDVDDPGSWNRYAYVSCDPVNHYDPKGTFCV
jgi:RHS repeat-associated protein